MGRAVPRSASEKLRADFAIWLQTHLGCQAVAVGIPIQHDRGKPPLVVDLRGERHAPLWRQMKSIGVGAFLSVVALANVPDRPPWLTAVLNPVLFLSLLLLGVSYLARLRTRQYVLVHCRNFERRGTREDIRKLHDVLARVRTSRNAQWKPAEVIFVTGKKGFDPEALTFARTAGIRCYRRAKTGFRRCTISASAAPPLSAPIPAPAD